MGVVAFLLNDLELDVLIVQVRIVGFRRRIFRKVELAGEEEAGDLAGSEIAAEVQAGLGVFVLFDVFFAVDAAGVA